LRLNRKPVGQTRLEASTQISGTSTAYLSTERAWSDTYERQSKLQLGPVSINQLISSAAAEKLAALMTEEYLAERAKRASKAKFAAALSRVPRAKPVDGDELPAAYARRNRRRAG
jgi:hypothetical protein